jgi:DNA-damage-inducible protein D
MNNNLLKTNKWQLASRLWYTLASMSEPSIKNLSFEDLRHENGMCYWWARQFMVALGYDDWRKFERVLNKAIQTCMNLDKVSHYIEFRFEQRSIDGEEVQDCKLSRFACFLVAMNGDSNIPQVALAQAYFAALAEQHLDQVTGEDVERLSIRKELADGNTALGSVFKRAGGQDFAIFNYVGFVAMYNAKKEQVARRKGINERDLYERMGRAELAANLFRVTMTESRIKNQKIQGQRNLEGAHVIVGQQIRALVIENEGRPPEALPVSPRSIPEVKQRLKRGRKELQKVDTSVPTKKKTR